MSIYKQYKKLFIDLCVYGFVSISLSASSFVDFVIVVELLLFSGYIFSASYKNIRKFLKNSFFLHFSCCWLFFLHPSNFSMQHQECAKYTRKCWWCPKIVWSHREYILRGSMNTCDCHPLSFVCHLIANERRKKNDNLILQENSQLLEQA